MKAARYTISVTQQFLLSHPTENRVNTSHRLFGHKAEMFGDWKCVKNRYGAVWAEGELWMWVKMWNNRSFCWHVEMSDWKSIGFMNDGLHTFLARCLAPHKPEESSIIKQSPGSCWIHVGHSHATHAAKSNNRCSVPVHRQTAVCAWKSRSGLTSRVSSYSRNSPQMFNNNLLKLQFQQPVVQLKHIKPFKSLIDALQTSGHKQTSMNYVPGSRWKRPAAAVTFSKLFKGHPEW